MLRKATSGAWIIHRSSSSGGIGTMVHVTSKGYSAGWRRSPMTRQQLLRGLRRPALPMPQQLYNLLRLPGPEILAWRYLTIARSEEHTSELQSRFDLVCRLLLDK